MGTTLTGTTPQDTYDSLIKVTDNGPLSGTAKYLSDGLGNDSKLALSTGNIGIGTTSPADIIHIVDSASTAAIRLASTGAGSKVYRLTSQIIGVSNTGFAIRNETDTRNEITIDGAGNVGIGTGSPATRLHVANTATFTGGTNFSVPHFFLTSNSATTAGNTTRLALGVFDGSQVYLDCISTDNDGNAADLAIRTRNGGAPTEKVRILSGGGITFNGDTAAANALDDYEEGTWTPSLIFSGGSTGITYTTQAGKYVKIGSKVSVNCYVVLSNKGSSTGSARIDGLPFTVPNAAGNYSPAIVLLDGGITYTGQAQGFANINSTSVALGNVTEAGSATALTDTNFSNSSAIMISLTYLVS